MCLNKPYNIWLILMAVFQDTILKPRKMDGNTIAQSLCVTATIQI